MSLAALPMFIAKPINGIIGGLLVAYLCYDGICAKMDTGHIGFWDSPEFMWTIYLAMAVISPIAIIMTRRTITSDHPEEDAAAPPISAIEAETDPALTAEEFYGSQLLNLRDHEPAHAQHHCGFLILVAFSPSSAVSACWSPNLSPRSQPGPDLITVMKKAEAKEVNASSEQEEKEARVKGMKESRTKP